MYINTRAQATTPNGMQHSLLMTTAAFYFSCSVQRLGDGSGEFSEPHGSVPAQLTSAPTTPFDSRPKQDTLRKRSDWALK